ncbi:MAG: type II toxin-antitoxin system prevent-host-death family antitoxin [Anaerolineae bacterium]
MRAKVVRSNTARTGWRDVIDEAERGGTVVLMRYKRPVAAVIPYEDYLALQEKLEDLQDARDALAAYEEWRNAPESGVDAQELWNRLADEGKVE